MNPRPPPEARPNLAIALGRVNAGKTVAIDVTATELAIRCDDGVPTVRRTTAASFG